MSAFKDVYPNVKYFSKKMAIYEEHLYITLYDPSLSITEIPQEKYIFKRTIKDDTIAEALMAPLGIDMSLKGTSSIPFEKKEQVGRKGVAALYVIRANKYQGTDIDKKVHELVLENIFKMMHNPNSMHYLITTRYKSDRTTDALIKETSMNFDKVFKGIIRERIICGPMMTLYFYGLISSLDKSDIVFYITNTDIRGEEFNVLNSYGKLTTIPIEIINAANTIYAKSPTGMIDPLIADDIIWDPLYHFYSSMGFKCINYVISLYATGRGIKNI